jgi:N-acetylated-alpha-linked acidic dipeptidase
MRKLLAIAVFVALSACGTSAQDAKKSGDQSMIGFRSSRVQEEKDIEAKFDSYIDRADYAPRLKRLSARPHHVGSPYDKQNAEFIDSLYTSWGFDAKIEEFEVLFPTPKFRLLQMTAPDTFSASLSEPPLAEDSTSGLTSEQLPTYNAYSVDGDVSGELVYVNYGVPKDYEELDKHGIDVKGKIVIARYGGSWRGIKPKVAAEHGAIGCIIYSDPKGDGYSEGDVYPKGAYRNEHGVQRGSVADMPLYSGDPLTPGVGATKDAKRLAISDAKTLTKIPVLPISYGDALPLLKNLTGPVAPPEWRGALPITYRLGPGGTKVHLKLAFNWDIKPIYDVIARIKGSERPDEWVIRGNHHDGWVTGAEDPLSGQIAVLEEAKALGQLLKTGWKPKRTIIYCAWDGEEPGLLGSTEWVETHADELKTKAAIYINSDSNGRGFFGAGGSHTLEHFVNQVARDVMDPERHISVLERQRDVALVDGSSDEKKRAEGSGDLPIEALGSGSDFSPFLQHIGISSLNIGYGGESGGGSYHSIYDSYDYYTRFIDPTFEYGVALSETGGRMVLRCADADVLPFKFSSFSEEVSKYAKEVAKLADDMREETEKGNKNIASGAYLMASDPTEVFVVPKPKDPVPFLNFAPLQNAVKHLEQQVKEFEDAQKELGENSKLYSSSDQQEQFDNALIKTERALTTSDGLPRRPWYVHQIYAPGFYTGYSVKTLPGIREAIEQRNWDEANKEIQVVANTIDDYANQLSKTEQFIKSN